MACILLIGMGPSALSAMDSLIVRFKVLGMVRTLDVGPNEVDPVVDRAHKYRHQERGSLALVPNSKFL